MRPGSIDIAEVKAAIPLSDVIGADVSWDARRSNAAKGDFWAPCPFHQEKTPSFHVDDRKGFYYCFGCQQKGDAVTYLQEQHGLDFQAALARLADLAGMQAPEIGTKVRRSRTEVRDARAAGEVARMRGSAIGDNPHPHGDELRPAWREGWQDADDRQKAEHAWITAREGLVRAAAIWRESLPAHPVLSAYLAARGVDLEPMARIWPHGLPPTIRCHPDLPYYVHDRSGGRPLLKHRGPAMIGLIASPEFRLGAHGGVAGIHRTWITPEGRARIAGQKLDKRMLGATGSMRAVPIRITAHTRRMIVGEGIETVLTLWSRLLADWLAGTRPFWSAEVAKTLGALAGEDDPWSREMNRATGRPWPGTVPDWRRPGWQAPDHVDELVILAEGSSKDPEAPRRTYTRALRRHQRRRDGSARACRLALPGGRWDRDVDFADVAAMEG